MGVLEKFFGSSPFVPLYEHAKKVHECVELLRPLVENLLSEDYGKIEELHHQMSRTEHEADQIKTELRDSLSKMYFLSVGQGELSQFLAFQDDIADSAEDFAVILTLRRTKMPEELREDFTEFVEQVIKVSKHLLVLSEKLSTIAEAGFVGKEVKQVLEDIAQIGQEEWQADKLERRFARHFYSMEDKLDAVTISFFEKYCNVLGAVANNAEKTAKYLRLILRKK